MKHRGPQPDIVIRLFDEQWQRWELGGGAPRRLRAEDAENGSRRTLAVPARQVVASPLWIDGTDPAIVSEAAKLELEVRGLLSRAQGMDGVSLRLLPGEKRTLAVVGVFPPELPESCPSAERFDSSPFLFSLPRDAVTLWREGDDYAAAFTRGSEVIYWETIDRSVGSEELRTWLSLIVLRLQAEDMLAAPPRVVSWIEGVPAAKIAPPGCAALDDVADDAATGTPSLQRVLATWKPASARLAELRRSKRERMRTIVLAVAAGYVVLAAVLVLYAGVQRWRAARLTTETARLRAEVQTFQPIARDWSLVAPTADPSQFPLELLRGAIEAMPADGIRLTKFTVDTGKMVIEGEAKDYASATDFQANLKRSEALRGIDWSGTTNPTVEGPVTRFHAEGILPTTP
ncbi:MAG: PilN domain-containing protein [Terrimicrobiaceae bacterium]|nr:PilN domain-containing protein [Terrimicrobiaceae bacterium]